MLVTFYGVRGSIPAPGPTTVKYGGNTSCVHVRLNGGQNLIFDAGTGIRRLGLRLAGDREAPVLLVLSHGHWDHIQGYPFFEPIYQPERLINVIEGVDGNKVALHGLLKQMDGSNFPVHAEDLPSSINSVPDVPAFLASQDYEIRRMPINHPGGGYGYRIEEDGVSVVYITDNELVPPAAPETAWSEWVEFVRGVDLLIHDAQYDERDIPEKHGWGHSLISQVRRLAVDAQVRNLVMFHHDPERSDGELDEVAIENARFFKSAGARIGAWIAAEGLTFELARRKDPRVSTVDLYKIF